MTMCENSTTRIPANGKALDGDAACEAGDDENVADEEDESMVVRGKKSDGDWRREGHGSKNGNRQASLPQHPMPDVAQQQIHPYFAQARSAGGAQTLRLFAKMAVWADTAMAKTRRAQRNPLPKILPAQRR